MSEINKRILLIIAVIALAILIVKAIHIIINLLTNRKNKRILSQSTPISEHTTQLPEIDSQARSELLNSAYRLEGILEALYQLGEGQMGNKEATIFEWTMRINGMPDASYLQNAWKLATNDYKNWTNNDYMNYARKISHEWLLSGGSIRRDNRSDLLVQASTESEYSTIDGQQLPINTKAIILRPCWYYKGSVLEKGVIKEEK